MTEPLRVLLADDTPAILRFLRFALEEDGRFEIVGEVGDGAEAVRLAAAEHPNAVVLDLAMPVMDGLQAIPEIRRYSPETKIVVLSGFKAEDMEGQALTAGADSYLEKGSAFKELASVLSMLCLDGSPA
jgi:DNA-binding NarL/FixJ family response regulator